MNYIFIQESTNGKRFYSEFNGNYTAPIDSWVEPRERMRNDNTRL